MRAVGLAHRVDCRGFSLVELALVLVLLGPAVALATTLALRAGREAGEAAAITAAEASQEMVAMLAEAELAPLVPSDGILAISTTAVRYRANRAVGRWCHLDSTGITVPLGTGRWAASRLPVPGRDSIVLLIVDGSAPTGHRRLRLPLQGAPMPATCPGGSGGLLLPLAGAAAVGPLIEVVQTEEIVELASYLSGGSIWMGLRSIALGSPIEPVAGPFDLGGVGFEGLDSLGVPTTTPGRVAAVRINLGSASALTRGRTILVRLRG